MSSMLHKCSALCKLGTVIPSFLLVAYWATSLAVVIFLKTTHITGDLYRSLFGHYRYGEELPNHRGKGDALAIAQGVLFEALAGLLLDVGILGSQERRAIKTQESVQGCSVGRAIGLPNLRIFGCISSLVHRDWLALGCVIHLTLNSLIQNQMQEGGIIW